MKNNTPTYIGHDHNYKADTCVALEQAALNKDVDLCALKRGHYPGDQMPEGVLSGVKTLGYWNAPKDQSWGLDWHRNEGVELTFVDNGSLEFSTENTDFQLVAGDLTITRPWQVHRVGNPNVRTSKLFWVILDLNVRRPNQEWVWPDWVTLMPEDIEQLTYLLRHNEQAVWQGTVALKECWGKLGKSITEIESPRSYSRIINLLNELLLNVLETLENQSPIIDTTLSSSARAVDLFLKELSQNSEVCAQQWTLELMAAQCGLKESQFSQICRKATNQSPMRYLNRCRVGFAKTLLAGSDDSVLSVAMQCGYTTRQYFATVFKNETKLTPKHWRSLNTHV